MRIWQGKHNYPYTAWSNATSSTTNPTRPELGSNPGRCRKKSATNPLSCDMALTYVTFVNLVPITLAKTPSHGSTSFLKLFRTRDYINCFTFTLQFYLFLNTTYNCASLFFHRFLHVSSHNFVCVQKEIFSYL